MVDRAHPPTSALTISEGVASPTNSLSVRQLARRWRCAPKKVRAFIKRGILPAFDIGTKRSELRISPEAVRVAEQGVLAVKQPPKRRKREQIDPDVAALLAGE
jgi:hypothetical protein